MKMPWLLIGWRNLWRNKRRTAIELMAVAGAVTISIFFVNLAEGLYSQMIDIGAETGKGHLALYRDNYLEYQDIELVYDPAPLRNMLETIPNLKAALPRVNAFGLIRSSRDNRAGALLGMDLERERGINPIVDLDTIVKGALPVRGERVVQGLIGAELAEALNIDVGSRFVWSCQGAYGGVEDHLLRVAGIVKTGLREVDRSALIVDVEDAGRLIGAPGMIHEKAIVLTSSRYLEEARGYIAANLTEHPAQDVRSGNKNESGHAAGLQLYTWDQTMPELHNSIMMDRMQYIFMLGLIILIVGIGTTNTLIMAIMERNREFGILRAVGAARGLIARIVFAEAFSLAATGGAIGLLLGSILTQYTNTYGIDFSFFTGDMTVEFAGIQLEMFFYSDWNPGAMALIVALIGLITLAAAIYPAHLAMKVQPAEAMKDH